MFTQPDFGCSVSWIMEPPRDRWIGAVKLIGLSYFCWKHKFELWLRMPNNLLISHHRPVLLFKLEFLCEWYWFTTRGCTQHWLSFSIKVKIRSAGVLMLRSNPIVPMIRVAVPSVWPLNASQLRHLVTDRYVESYSVRVVKFWNRIPNFIGTAPSFNSFKRQVDLTWNYLFQEVLWLNPRIPPPPPSTPALSLQILCPSFLTL